MEQAAPGVGGGQDIPTLSWPHPPYLTVPGLTTSREATLQRQPVAAPTPGLCCPVACALGGVAFSPLGIPD